MNKRFKLQITEKLKEMASIVPFQSTKKVVQYFSNELFHLAPN